MTNRSCVSNPPILTQKQQKVAIFQKTDFLGLKYPPEARVEPKTCSTICGTSVLAISNHKNSAGTAGGAREGQNMAHLGHINFMEIGAKMAENKKKSQKKHTNQA